MLDDEPNKHASLSVSIIALIFSGIAAVISYKQMNIAEEYYNQSKSQSQIQTRAYLSISSVKLRKFAVGEKPEVDVFVKNVGSTPALDVQVHYMATFIEVDEPTPGLLLGAPTRRTNFIPQGADSFYRFFDNRYVGISENQEFLNNKKTYKLQIAFVYKDVYGKAHTDAYCFMKSLLRQDDNEAVIYCDDGKLPPVKK